MITLVPTLRRTTLLSNFVRSLVESETSTHGVIIIDQNDYKDNEVKYVEISKSFPKGWSYLITPPNIITMGDKVRAAYRMTEGYKAVNLLNDDHYIITKGWDKKLLSKITGWNFVTCNDNWMSPAKAAGATVFSKKLLDEIGWPIFPPGMIHLFIDDLWESIGRTAGCWLVDHSVLIEHRHPLKKESPVDDTFKKTYGTAQDLRTGKTWQNDQKIMTDTLNKCIHTIIDKARKLQGLYPIERNA